MKVNGIIAEYNPFHNGHRYHLEESLRLTGADYTVVVMSGDFVQRGGPALADKWARSRMALCCGADLVLELPVLYATASAEYFAAGAVALLDRLGTVTHLCFGSECGDTGQLRKIAEFLLEEPAPYRAALKHLLKQGLSYPSARTHALAHALTDVTADTPKNTPADTTAGVLKNTPADAPATVKALENIAESTALPDSGGASPAELLSLPNNILGTDYIKALLRRGSGILPVTVQRAGAGYHDGSFHPSSLSSAKAIRQALQEGQSPADLRPHLPEAAYRILESCLAERRIRTEDFSPLLYYRLVLEKAHGYEKYLDISASLSDRIQRRLRDFSGFEAFCGLLKTKEMTHARIRRGLLHILLGIEKEHMVLGQSLDCAPYARVLGFRRSAVPLLGAIKRHSSIPLITKLADAEKILPGPAMRLLRMDLLANEIYMGAAYAGSGKPAPNEFSAPLVIL